MVKKLIFRWVIRLQQDRINRLKPRPPGADDGDSFECRGRAEGERHRSICSVPLFSLLSRFVLIDLCACVCPTVERRFDRNENVVCVASALGNTHMKSQYICLRAVSSHLVVRRHGGCWYCTEVLAVESALVRRLCLRDEICLWGFRCSRWGPRGSLGFNVLKRCG